MIPKECKRLADLPAGRQVQVRDESPPYGSSEGVER